MPEQAKEFDWSGINGEFTDRLKGEKVPDVPEPIVKLAQMSYDGDAEGRHVMRREFKTEEMAAAFHKHVKNAGHHTTPQSSVRANIDPDETGNKRLVAWRAGQRRGRKSAA